MAVIEFGISNQSTQKNVVRVVIIGMMVWEKIVLETNLMLGEQLYELVEQINNEGEDTALGHCFFQHIFFILS